MASPARMSGFTTALNYNSTFGGGYTPLSSMMKITSPKAKVATVKTPKFDDLLPASSPVYFYSVRAVDGAGAHLDHIAGDLDPVAQNLARHRARRHPRRGFPRRGATAAAIVVSPGPPRHGLRHCIPSIGPASSASCLRGWALAGQRPTVPPGHSRSLAAQASQ